MVTVILLCRFLTRIGYYDVADEVKRHVEKLIDKFAFRSNFDFDYSLSNANQCV